jgi:hypothetical protein
MQRKSIRNCICKLFSRKNSVLAKALLRRRRISSILIYIHDIASNLINWGPVTGPHDFLPPLPSTDDPAGLDASEEENFSEYNIVIDEWIKVVDDDAGALRTRKRAQGLPDADTEDSLSVRRDLTRLYHSKERRIAAPSSKKRRIDAVDDDEDSPLPPSPFPEATPSRQETSSDISSSSRRQRA